MMRLRKLSFWFTLTTLAVVTASGCSDDDDSDNDGSGGTSSSGRGGSSGSGTAGRGGSGGIPGTAGDTGNPVGGSPINVGGEPSVAGAGGAFAGAAGDGGAGGGASEVAALSDAQILLVLDTLNAGEVEEAYAALPRLTDAEIKAFAQRMITHHGAARQDVAANAETLALSPQPSEKAAELKAESEAHVALIRATAKSSLDATYIHLEVGAHAEALALLNVLADAADAAALTTLIGTLEATVQEHYDDAVALEGQLP